MFRSLVLIVLLFSFNAFCESGKISGLMMEVQVISDEFNKDVPQGTFAVRGHVWQMYASQTPVYNAIITNSKENPSVSTDSLGFFEMLFPISDSAIFCYKIGLNEIIFKGPFNNRHLIELNFYLADPKIPVVCTKPVIYAYNAASTFSVELIPPGGFTFTYPKYQDKWTMRTNSDGTLSDVNSGPNGPLCGKNYPYLFWEGEGKNLDFKIENNSLEGFIIKTDTCVSFLENILANFGLNEKEATDFITWWGPQLIKKDYALIQFLTTEQYGESIAEINISPEPDRFCDFICILNLFIIVNWN